MNAEYPVVDDDREGEKVKHIGKVLPHGRAAVFPHAFRVESVRLTDREANQGSVFLGVRIPRAPCTSKGTDLCHCATLVVPSDELDAVRIPQFEAGQERDGLDAEQPSVDVVAEEEVVGFGRETAVLEQAQQVVVLSVDVTCMSGMRPSSAASNSK